MTEGHARRDERHEPAVDFSPEDEDLCRGCEEHLYRSESIAFVGRGISRREGQYTGAHTDYSTTYIVEVHKACSAGRPIMTSTPRNLLVSNIGLLP